MRIDDMIAGCRVTVIMNDGKEIKLEESPEELLECFAHNKPIEGIDEKNREEFKKVFIETAKKNMMRTFLSCYHMWEDRYKCGFWDEETFKKRIGRKGPFTGTLGGSIMWEEITKDQ